MSNVDENSLDDNKLAGETKAGERTVLLTPDYPLCGITKGDILCVPWGITPNTWCPLGSLAPAIVINTPSGKLPLIWADNQYSGTGLTLSFDEQWCLSGDVEHCFEGSFVTDTWPEGYSFHRKSGPYAEFKIIRMTERIDHLGRISHYRLEVDSENIKGITLQE